MRYTVTLYRNIIEEYSKTIEATSRDEAMKMVRSDKEAPDSEGWRCEKVDETTKVSVD